MPENPPIRSGATVTVACKLPHGLILRTFSMIERDVPVLGGGMRTEKIAQHDGRTFKVNGSAVPFGQAPGHPISGGFAITPGIPADFWDLWLSQNADSDLVKNGLIFASDKTDYASDKARERASQRSGLEPIDPGNPSVRLGNAGRTGLKIEKGDLAA